MLIQLEKRQAHIKAIAVWLKIKSKVTCVFIHASSHAFKEVELLCMY